MINQIMINHNDNADTGQTSTHLPIPSHLPTSLDLPSITFNAYIGHSASHIPQPIQASVSI